MLELGLLLPFIFLGALLYTSVGHGGATIYTAILVLSGYAPITIRTPVLVLNVLAASIAFVHFERAGHLRWNLLWPFLLTSVPAAYVGARVHLTAEAVSILLASALLAASLRLLLVSRVAAASRLPDARSFRIIALGLGALLGFLAGATGIGGGIFLSPLLVFLGWATVPQAGSIASAFIVANSLAGLAGRLQQEQLDWTFLGPLLVVVGIGAALGGYLGARRIPPRALQVLLGLVLLVAVARIAIDLDLAERVKALI